MAAHGGRARGAPGASCDGDLRRSGCMRVCMGDPRGGGLCEDACVYVRGIQGGGVGEGKGSVCLSGALTAAGFVIGQGGLLLPAPWPLVLGFVIVILTGQCPCGLLLLLPQPISLRVRELHCTSWREELVVHPPAAQCPALLTLEEARAASVDHHRHAARTALLTTSHALPLALRRIGDHLVMLCLVWMLCYVMLCYAVLCYGMVWYWLRVCLGA